MDKEFAELNIKPNNNKKEIVTKDIKEVKKNNLPSLASSLHLVKV